MSQWLRSCTILGVLCGKRDDGPGSNLGMFFFLLFLFFLSSSSLYVWICDEGFIHFLQIVAKSPSAFPK